MVVGACEGRAPISPCCCCPYIVALTIRLASLMLFAHLLLVAYINGGTIANIVCIFVIACIRHRLIMD